MTDENESCELGYRLTVFIFVVVVLFLYVDETISDSYKAILILILFLLFACEYYCNKVNNYVERFGRSGDRITKLNNTRGTLGNFHVACHKCGRSRIIDEKIKMNHVKHHVKHNIKNKTNGTMSFYNKKYIDTDQIYCYNCLLDTDTQSYLRNHNNFPYINGPPGTNKFTH